MKLEEIARTYGMHDYYDMASGRTYQLSNATATDDGKLSVPVIEDGKLIGYASMDKVE